MVALESFALFRGLGRDELQALRVIAQERHFAALGDIFQEGDPGDGVFFVKDGLVAISSLVGANNRRVFSQLGPGEIFGEMAVLEHRPRSATATAVRDSDVFFLPRGEMLSLLQRSPALAFSLLQQISQRLREFDQLYLREVLQAERLAVVGNFARSIVHDLKNPLSIISLSAETLDRPEIRPEARALAGTRIRKQVERIGDMVNDILIFTEGKRTDVEARASWRTLPSSIAALRCRPWHTAPRTAIQSGRSGNSISISAAVSEPASAIGMTAAWQRSTNRSRSSNGSQSSSVEPSFFQVSSSNAPTACSIAKEQTSSGLGAGRPPIRISDGDGAATRQASAIAAWLRITSSANPLDNPPSPI